ncbi:hypothetical protein [Shewanella algidipiscicola]|uniref:Uncharacterized protein n=1 Tax=Shewanella algidipiscicola TaxID=614070 RepID=A0ABQ4PD21_9GAMM|nr:hypothetical protein [Shewanella algidipiscicola]GIU45339.1 hypothetical protein TUM4630_13170 [Shewanella algidipiscicola]
MNKFTRMSLVAATFIGISFSATAEDFIPNDISATLERQLAAQMQDAITLVKQELTLSLQAQLSESLFDSGFESSNPIEEPATSDQHAVIASVSQKD